MIIFISYGKYLRFLGTLVSSHQQRFVYNPYTLIETLVIKVLISASVRKDFTAPVNNACAVS